MFKDIQHIKTYSLKDLVGKTIRVLEFKSEDGTITAAIDLNTRLIYVIEINCTSELPKLVPGSIIPRSK